MVNRINNAQETDVNSRSTSDRSSLTHSPKAGKNLSDEIIVSLANNYENKRARQVTEWERVQAANIRRSV
jgi:hypothetical protein